MDTENLAIRFLGYDLLSGVARTVSDAIEGVGHVATSVGGGLANSFITVGATLMGIGAIFETMALILTAGMLAATLRAANFESELVLMVTHSNLAAGSIDHLREQILSLAPSKFAPEEIAHALFQIASLGNFAGHEVEVEAQAIKLAAIGHADLQKTTEALATTMLAFGANTTQAARYAGILNGIVGSGRMRMEDLNAALGTGLAIAAQNAGDNIISLGGALATMTDFNIPATQAATSLRFAYASLQGPTKAAAKELAALGLSEGEIASYSKDASAALAEAGVTHSELADHLAHGGLIEVLQVLKQHMNALGISAQDQGTIVSKAFGGARSAKGMETMFQHLDQLVLKTDQVSAKSLTLAANYDYLIAHDPAYAWATMGAELNKIVVVLGEAFIPVFAMIAPTVIKVEEAIVHWIRTHQALIAQFGKFAVQVLAVVGGIFLVVGAVMMTIGWFIALGSAVLGAMGGIVTAAMGAGAILVAILSTVGPFISFVIDMALFFFGQVGMAIRNFALVWELILDIAGAIGLAGLAGGILVVILVAAALIIISQWKQISDMFMAFASRIGPALMKVFQMIGEGQHPLLIITTFLHNMGLTWEQVGSVMQLATRIWGVVMDVVRQVVSQFQILIKSLTSNKEMMDALHQGWDALAKVMPIIITILGVIAVVIGALLSGAFFGLMAALSHFIPGAIQIVIGVFMVFSGVIRLVADIVIGIWTLLVDIFTGRTDKLGKDLSDIWNNIRHDIIDIISGLGFIIRGLWQATVDTIASFVWAFAQHFVGFFFWIYDQLVGHSIIPDIVNGILYWFLVLPGRILGIALDFAGRVLNAFNALKDGMWSIGWNIVQGLESGLRAAWWGFVGTFRNLASALPSAIQHLLGISSPSLVFATQVGTPIIQGVAMGILDNAALVGQALATATNPNGLAPAATGRQVGAALASASPAGSAGGRGGTDSDEATHRQRVETLLTALVSELMKDGTTFRDMLATLKNIDNDTPNINAGAAQRRTGASY